jgi:DHA1 family inner membrane transport protein
VVFKKLLPLALATFAVGTDGFVIAGLLPAIAQSLKVSIPAAGQLVTLYALTYAVAAPVLGAVTSAMDRRTALLMALTIFTIGNVATAVGGDYPMVLLARVVTAAGAGIITAVAAATAAALTPSQQRGRALAFVMGGLTTATALGVPLGTLIGGVDWRLTLWAVAALSLIAAIGIAIGVPKISLPATGLRDRIAPLRDPAVGAVLVVTFAILASSYTLYAYIGPAVAGATGGSTSALTTVLLTYGLGSVAGNLLSGRLSDRYRPEGVLFTGLVAMVVVLGISPLVVSDFAATVVWVAGWGAVGWLTMVPQQHRLVSLAPQATTVLLGLNASAIYLGTAAGGGIGGLSLRWLPPGRLGLLAGCLSAMTLVIAVITIRRSARRTAPVPATTP